MESINLHIEDNIAPILFFNPLVSTQTFQCKEYFTTRLITHGYNYIVINKSRRNLDEVIKFFHTVNLSYVPFTWTEVQSGYKNVNSTHWIYKIESPQAIKSKYGADILGYCLKFLWQDYRFLTQSAIHNKQYLASYSPLAIVQAIYQHMVSIGHYYIANDLPFPNVDNSVFSRIISNSGLFNVIKIYNSLTGRYDSFDRIIEKIVPKHKLLIGIDKNLPESTKFKMVASLLEALEATKDLNTVIGLYKQYKYQIGGPNIEIIDSEGGKKRQKYALNNNKVISYAQSYSEITFEQVNLNDS